MRGRVDSVYRVLRGVGVIVCFIIVCVHGFLPFGELPPRFRPSPQLETEPTKTVFGKYARLGRDRKPIFPETGVETAHVRAVSIRPYSDVCTNSIGAAHSPNN